MEKLLVVGTADRVLSLSLSYYKYVYTCLYNDVTLYICYLIICQTLILGPLVVDKQNLFSIILCFPLNLPYCIIELEFPDRLRFLYRFLNQLRAESFVRWSSLRGMMQCGANKSDRNQFFITATKGHKSYSLRPFLSAYLGNTCNFKPLKNIFPYIIF